AGNSLNGSWGNTVEEVSAFSPYKGKLYAGLGNTANADSSVWAYGDNGFVESSTATFNTNWHHVAATYDGTTLRVYIDGVLSGTQSKTLAVNTSSNELYIGAGYGGREVGRPRARFNGQIDELRLSSTTRTNF